MQDCSRIRTPLLQIQVASVLKDQDVMNVALDARDFGASDRTWQSGIILRLCDMNKTVPRPGEARHKGLMAGRQPARLLA